MSHAIDDLYTRLQRGPVALFLGQDYLSLESGTDPFLSDISRKYKPNQSEAFGYSLLLNGQAQDDPESSIAWMHNRSERLSIPEWLKTVADFPWNAVFTSAVDNLWYRAFRSEWRELHPLFEAKYRPSDARNRLNLHCTFLFGCVNQVEETKRPPLNRREWLRRKQEATVLIQQLPEIVTPLGLLLIEGYAFERDWFTPDDLIPLIDEFSPGQVHLFSVKPDIRSGVELRSLVEEGKLTFHSESLYAYLLDGEQQGYLRLGLRPEEQGVGPTVQLGNRLFYVPSDIWNTVSRSARVLDDSLLEPPHPVSKEREYQDFLKFLSESSIAPVWSAYPKRFPFKRHFEKLLHEVTVTRLNAKSLQREPIILHGQSGTGKTVALGSLAYEVKIAGRYPVLYIRRQSQRPVYDDLDMFCKWAEDKGASSTLIVWDGMLEADQYYSMLHYLTGRGRKVVLVGSCYRIKESESQISTRRRMLIEASAELTSDEIELLPKYLDNFDPRLKEMLETTIRSGDATFLTWLYRLLPATRGGLQRNLLQEVVEFERKMVDSGNEAEPQLSELGYALWKAGLIMPQALSSEATKTIARDQFTEPQELVGLVMLPGRLGLRVPIELLLRALGRSGWSSITETLRSMDIFAWYEDVHSGNLSIGPRHPLEAQIIAQARLGSAEAEIVFAKELLIEIHDDGTTESPEVQFAVDFLRGLGPNGQYSERFGPFFLDLSQTLEELRQQRGVKNPRLMLQEATLLREYVSYCAGKKHMINGFELYDKAESVLWEALRLLPETAGTAKQRSVIFVELGTTWAAKTHVYLEGDDYRDLPLKSFKKAREFLFQARALSPDDYHPLDVLGWMTEDLLKKHGDLDLEFEAEVKADILHIFSLADPEIYDLKQRERFHGMRWRIGNLLGRSDISENAFQSLVSQGSKAGYYLRAQYLAGTSLGDRQLNESQKQKFGAAVAYLEQHRTEIVGDSRCLYLLLRLWWMIQTGKPILMGERQVVAFDHEKWRYVLKLAIELLETQGQYPAALLKYLRGLAEFHLGSVESSIMHFRELQHDINAIPGARRIIRSFLASTSEGQPVVYKGSVAWVDDMRNRGAIYVEDLRCNITMLPVEFSHGRLLRQGDPITRFHIAFNFIGPIAEPVSYFKH